MKALTCCICEREQTIVAAGASGGVTAEEAMRFDWRQGPARYEGGPAQPVCPICMAAFNQWLRDNLPPEGWDPLDWAFSECPIGLISGVPGRLL